MRLVFCLFRYFAHSGLSRDMLSIAAEADRRGHRVSVFASAWEGAVPEHMELELISSRGYSNHSRARTFSARVASILRSYPRDLVLGFNKMHSLDVYYAADSCIAQQAAVRHSPLYRLTPRYRTFLDLERAVCGPAARTEILLLSEATGRAFMQYHQTPESRLHLLPATLRESYRGAHSANCDPARIRRELGLDERGLLILFVGSGFRTKGLDRAVRAVASLTPPLRDRARLVVVGRDNAARYARLARRLGVGSRVSFLGGRDDVPDLLRAADLLLHPAYFENTGTVLLEALVSGLPVLTTDACGYASHIARMGAGLVLPSPFDQQRLDDALSRVLGAPAERRQMAQAGVRHADDPLLYGMPAAALDHLERFAVRSGP